MKTAIKIAGLCLTLALASCGGGDSTAPAASTNPNTIVAADPTAPAGTPAATPAVANTGTVTVNTTPGNIVSIGASGTTSLTADATGKAVFTGLPAGVVDVHVFKVDGTEVTSYYGLNSNLVNDTTGAAALSSSQIVIAGSMVNYNTNGLSGDTFHLVDGKGNSYAGSWDRVNNIVSFIVSEPVGTVISGMLYANTFNTNAPTTSSARNTVAGSSEIVNLGAVSFTTVAQLVGQPTLADVQGTPFTSTFTVTPAVPVLATINLVTPPAGMTLASLTLAEGSSSWTNGSGVALQPGATGAYIFPDTINAVGFPGANDYTVSASSAGGSWYKVGTFTVGGTLSITAAMTNMPTVAANQTGSTIMWTESTSAHAVNFATISATVGAAAHSWSIQAASGVNSIVLPTVPAGVTAPLPIGTVGTVGILSVNTSATYEQIAAATNFNGVAFERVSANSVAYTR